MTDKWGLISIFSTVKIQEAFIDDNAYLNKICKERDVKMGNIQENKVLIEY